MSNPNDTILSISRMGEGVNVSWSGGFPPYQLQRSDFVGGPWTNSGNPTMATSSAESIIFGKEYFRVWQSVPLLKADDTKPPTTLVWSVPDLAPDTFIADPPPPPN